MNKIYNQEYSKRARSFFFNPKHAGKIPNADAIGREGNESCGDIMEIYLKIDKGKIKKIRFNTLGCIAAIASSEALCRIATGKTIKQAKSIDSKQIYNEIGRLPSIKVHCSVLGAEALQKAISNYEKNIIQKLKGGKNKQNGKKNRRSRTNS